MSEKTSFSQNWYENFYSKVNSSARNGSFANKALHRSLEREFTSNENYVILEVGANRGEHLGYVRQDFSKYILSDIRCVSGIEKLLTDRIEFEIADLENLHFKDETFDRVIVTCVFHHLKDPESGFREIRRVTKVGGNISIFLPNDPGFLYRFLRKITTVRNAKRLNLHKEAEVFHALEHRNQFLSLNAILNWVYYSDKVKARGFPLKFKSYSFNAFTVYSINRLS